MRRAPEYPGAAWSEKNRRAGIRSASPTGICYNVHINDRLMRAVPAVPVHHLPRMTPGPLSLADTAASPMVSS